MSLSLWAYSAAASAVYPFIKGILRRRHAEGFSERCGVYEKSKLDKISGGRTLWLHAVSVGEVQAAYQFVSMAAGSGLETPILLSTVTATGAKSARSLMGSGIAAHIYAPWDIPYIVRRACDALSPFVYVTVETEVWPNLLAELRGRGVPAALLNARVSDRTWLRAGFFKDPIREAYGMFDMILARGEEDSLRLSMMGADREKIHVTGDSKIDALIIRKTRFCRCFPLFEKEFFQAMKIPIV